MLTTLIPRARLGPLVVLLGLLVLGALALLPLRSPSPAAADAPAREFSAERAQPVIDALAKQPRPTGSPAGDAAREELVSRLAKLGLEPEVQRVSAANHYPDQTAVVGRVENIRATIPGSDGENRVLLVAHYDSVFTGPGATDNAMGVATVLEVARALKAGPAPRATVELLLTDGEEPGSLGARAYTEAASAADPEHTVVLNLEARGTHGRVVMFESGKHNAAVLGGLSGHTPFATSVSDEIYRLLPNDTDFTVFKDAGFTGMNFAIVGGSAYYDMELDDLAHQQPATLQDMGSTALSATRQLAGQDVAPGDSGESTWFTLYGLLIRYPQGLGTALAVLAAVGAGAALWYACRRGLARGRGATLVAATLPLPLVASAAVGFALWQVLTLLRPHYAAFMFGDPYRPGLATAGLVVLTAVLCLLWLVWMRRRRGPADVAAGVLGWFAALTLFTAFLLPGAGYLFLFPTLFGAAGLACATRMAGDSPWLPVTLSAAAVPNVVLFTPLVAVLFPTVGLAFAAAVLVVVALMLLPLLPGLLPLPRRRAVPAALTAGALLGCALLGGAAARNGPDAQHPAQADLVYVLDADSGRATWYGGAGSEHPWMSRYVHGDLDDAQSAVPALAQPGGYREGPAVKQPVPVPKAKVEKQPGSGDARTVRLRLTAEGPPATGLSLYAAPGDVRLLDVTVNGHKLPGGTNRPAGKRWTWGVHMVAPGDGPFEVTLRFRGEGTLPVKLLAYGAKAPAGAFTTPRPEDLAWTAAGFGHAIGMRSLEL